MKGETLLIFLSLYAFCLLYNKTQGSLISFVASPLEIKDGLTDSLTLRCSLNNTDASASIIGKRDITRTTENVAEVTTIVIMRDGDDIASISRSQSAQIMDGSVNVKINGSVAGRSGDQAFIELTIQNPVNSQLGEFVCEINAIRVIHAVTFSTSLEITSVAPSVADLAQTIRDMRNNENVMTQTIADLTNTIANLKLKPVTEIFFSAGLSVDKNIAFGREVIYDKIYANVGAAYDHTTGHFTCPTSGFYHFEMSALAQVGTSSFRLRLFVNDQKDISIAATHSYNGASNSGILKLSKGDVVKVLSENQNQRFSMLHSYAGGIYTTFNGQLVSLVP